MYNSSCIRKYRIIVHCQWLSSTLIMLNQKKNTLPTKTFQKLPKPQNVPVWVFFWSWKNTIYKFCKVKIRDNRWNQSIIFCRLVHFYYTNHSVGLKHFLSLVFTYFRMYWFKQATFISYLVDLSLFHSLRSEFSY